MKQFGLQEAGKPQSSAGSSETKPAVAEPSADVEAEADGDVSMVQASEEVIMEEDPLESEAMKHVSRQR